MMAYIYVTHQSINIVYIKNKIKDGYAKTQRMGGIFLSWEKSASCNIIWLINFDLDKQCQCPISSFPIRFFICKRFIHICIYILQRSQSTHLVFAAWEFIFLFKTQSILLNMHRLDFSDHLMVYILSIKWFHPPQIES